MYTYEQSKFGEWEKITLRNPTTGNSFSLVPTMGACLLNLCFQGQQVLDSFQSPEALKLGDWAKSAVLFPFPNRLRDGRYTFAGKQYQFPLNDASGPNAIHGFGRQKAFTVQDYQVTSDQGSITCLYEDSGEQPGYPFPFSVEMKFSISDDNGFEVSLTMTNLGTQAMPAGLGWHPYFTLGNTVDQYFLQLPACDLIEVDPTMIPTGRQTPYTNFNESTPIKNTILDSCFKLTASTSKRSYIKIESDTATLTYWQERKTHAWPFVQIFTPPHRKSIAIEPMTCNVDAFNNQDGLIILHPNQQFGGKFGLQFVKK
ncbi:MAG: aldose 1-epimerase [Saprospiraceae bacterium]